MNNIEYVALSMEIIDDIYNIEVKSFKKPWSKQEFINETENVLAKYFCLTLDKKVIGYIGVWEIFDEGHITNIAVLPEYRGKGYGNLLAEKIISYAEERNLVLLTLEVRKSNQAAINLYKKHNFIEVGLRKNYYENTEDAILMTKQMEEY